MNTQASPQLLSDGDLHERVRRTEEKVAELADMRAEGEITTREYNRLRTRLDSRLRDARAELDRREHTATMRYLVLVAPELRTRLDECAERQAITIEAVVNEAVARYLDGQPR